MQRNEADIFTAIRKAKLSGTFHHVIALVMSGADLCAINSQGQTPVQLARELRLWELIQVIAQNHQASDGDNERYGHALLSAVRHHQEATAIILLNKGASLVWQTDNDLNRAVHWAVKNRLLKILALISKKPESLTCINKDGHTPMQLAISLGYWDCVAVMVNNSTTNQVERLHDERASTLSQESRMHFKQLTSNAVKAKDIPSIIEKIDKNDLLLLTHLNQELNARIVSFSDILQPLSSQAKLLTGLQNNNIDVLTRTINSFLNYPHPCIPQQDKSYISQMRDMKIPEAEIIFHYMLRKEKIDAYVNKLGKWLIHFKQYLLTTPWQIKNLCGNWVYGDPAHVKDMLLDVYSITEASSQVEILDVYKKIMNILLTMPESSSRHDDTKTCYQLLRTEIQNIKFNAESPAPTITGQQALDVPRLPLVSTITNSANTLYSKPQPIANEEQKSIPALAPSSRTN